MSHITLVIKSTLVLVTTLLALSTSVPSVLAQSTIEDEYAAIRAALESSFLGVKINEKALVISWMPLQEDLQYRVAIFKVSKLDLVDQKTTFTSRVRMTRPRAGKYLLTVEALMGVENILGPKIVIKIPKARKKTL